MIHILPEEVLFDGVFHFLHPLTRVMCRSVCKRWKTMIDERYSGCGIIRYKIRDLVEPKVYVRDDSVIAICPCFHIFAEIHIHPINSFCDGLIRPDIRGQKTMFLGNAEHILVKVRGRMLLAVYLEYKKRVIVHEIMDLSNVSSSMRRVFELETPSRPKRKKCMVWAGDDIIFYKDMIVDGTSGIYFFNLMKTHKKPLFRLQSSNTTNIKVETVESDRFIIGFLGEFGVENHRIEIYSKNGDQISVIKCSYFQKNIYMDYVRIASDSSTLIDGRDFDVCEGDKEEKDVVYLLHSSRRVKMGETTSPKCVRMSQDRRIIAQTLPEDESVSVDVVYMFRRTKGSV